MLPYKFNGKELDAETGLYYYGARYYDPSAALWLGVDPLAEKYPDVSPYVYCAGNPVVRIDPDGRWFLALRMNVTAGVGMSYALSAKAECGIAFDKYSVAGFKGTATFSNGLNSVKYDVTCKAVNGQPSNQWETHAYTANKQGEQ